MSLEQQGLARRNDRITSVLAAESITDTLPTKELVLDILRTQGPMPHDWICDAHTKRVLRGEAPRKLSRQRIRTVCKQLVDDGLVEATDDLIKLPSARCASHVWRAVDA